MLASAPIRTEDVAKRSARALDNGIGHAPFLASVSGCCLRPVTVTQFAYALRRLNHDIGHIDPRYCQPSHTPLSLQTSYWGISRLPVSQPTCNCALAVKLFFVIHSAARQLLTRPPFSLLGCLNKLRGRIQVNLIGQRLMGAPRERLPSKVWLPTPSTSNGTFSLHRRTTYSNRAYRPSIPATIQNAVFVCILDMLGGVAKNNLEREHPGRKRNRSRQPVQADRPGRARVDHDVVPMDPHEVMDSSHGVDIPTSPPFPPILSSLTVGINEVTKRLERLAISHRSQVQAEPDQDNLSSDTTSASPSCVVIACRGDIDPPILMGHVPNLVATCNSARRAYNTHSPQSGGTWLVPMPKGTEETLSVAMGLRRVSMLLVEVCLPRSSRTWLSSRSHRVPRPNIPLWCHCSSRSRC